MENDPAQMVNLIDDPKLASDIQRHRQLLDSWIAKGDCGEGEESQEELAFQTINRWGSVNPEYESVRTDGDGDGLSGEWETLNGRDPDDGKLMFKFDNGGWQTEGWEAEGNLGNIAGYLGYLDFELPNGIGAIVRKGLNVSAANNSKSFEITARASSPVLAWLYAANESGNMERIAGPITVEETADARTYSLSISGKPQWTGMIKELRIGFKAEPGTSLEIDAIVFE